MAYKKSVDVVIPTFSGNKISKTISSLNFGKIKPKNIYLKKCLGSLPTD